MTEQSGRPTDLRRPAVTTPDPWHFPDPEVSTLPNGLTVWTFRLPGQHVVSAELVMPTPLSVEPSGAEGVATLTMRLADEGTQQHPGHKISELLEDQGAAYSGQVTFDAAVASLDVPGTRLVDAWPLFCEIVRTPSFAPVDVARHVDLRLSELDQTRAHAGGLAALGVRRLLWDTRSRWSRPSGGLATTVASLDDEAVRAHHTAHWGPDGAVLVLAGDFLGDVSGIVAQGLGDWRPRQVSAAPTPAAARADGAHVVHLIDRPGSVQAELRVAGVGIDRRDADWPALQAGFVAMGGSFLSRLNRALREEHGYTYGAHAHHTPARSGGSWQVSTSCRTDVAAPALTEAIDLLAATEQFSAAEAMNAVNQLVGVAPLRYDTAAGVAGQATSLASAGLDADQVNRHFTAVAALTPELVTDAWRRRVLLDEAVTLVVGDQAALEPALTAAGFTVRDMPDPTLG